MNRSPKPAWRKSSYSGGSGDNCVEIAGARSGVAMRDSKNPGGGVLTFTPREWNAFLGRIKGGGLVE